MKTLTLLRHAKSGWDDGVARDFDRPLNPKGRRAATLIGRHLRGEGIRFDHVAASPAQRVVETLEALAGGYGGRLPIAWERRLYLAATDTLIDVARALPDAVGSTLLVGHNPGLEELVLMLVAADDPNRIAAAEKYPTATVAELLLPIDRWRDIAPASAQLRRFIRPRDLDPSLGPETD